jgi:hypothetical protein
MTDDRQLDKVSRHILADLDEVKRLKRAKRHMPRSSPEFHDTAKAVERAARHVWEHAEVEEQLAHEDSRIPEERAEQIPGDWTRHGDN